MIATSALLFGYFSQSVLAADLGKPQAVPTSYAPAPAGAALPAGYQKADYAAVADPSPPRRQTHRPSPWKRRPNWAHRPLGALRRRPRRRHRVHEAIAAAPRPFPGVLVRRRALRPSRTPQDPGFSFSLDAVTGERFRGSPKAAF